MGKWTLRGVVLFPSDFHKSPAPAAPSSGLHSYGCGDQEGFSDQCLVDGQCALLASADKFLFPSCLATLRACPDHLLHFPGCGIALVSARLSVTDFSALAAFSQVVTSLAHSFCRTPECRLEIQRIPGRRAKGQETNIGHAGRCAAWTKIARLGSCSWSSPHVRYSICDIISASDSKGSLEFKPRVPGKSSLQCHDPRPGTTAVLSNRQGAQSYYREQQTGNV